MRLYALLIAQGLLWLVAVLMAMKGFDAAAWITMNISILLGCVNSILAWHEIRLLIIGSGIIFLKISLVLLLATDWWTIKYNQEMPYTHPNFFWLTSLFLLVVGAFETASVVTVKGRQNNHLKS